MSIAETQLETWSHQGSITQSSATYNTIKSALENPNAPYSDKSFKVFLQGSYGNDTNIYSESDVDIVIQLDDCYQYDLAELPQNQANLHNSSMASAPYTHVNFKADVTEVLNSKYGSDVKAGEKAITISANGNRRKADVIVAIQFRRFYKFNGFSDQNYDEGICFYSSDGTQIVNYPRKHSENMTAKHQGSSQWLKPMVRILKNIRSKLVESKAISPGIAPSYYLEGLLYNVPSEKFGESYSQSLYNCIEWIQAAEKSKFLCANEQYYLFREGSPVTWRESNFEIFMSALIDFWNQS